MTTPIKLRSKYFVGKVAGGKKPSSGDSTSKKISIQSSLHRQAMQVMTYREAHNKQVAKMQANHKPKVVRRKIKVKEI